MVGCVLALGWVPWVLVFDNMKTVTARRDAQQQPIWHPALLQLAAEFDFHPEACWPRPGNQKGSVESLVKWVKGNFLAGRVFADDADLGGAVRGVADVRQHAPIAGHRRSATGAAGGGGGQGWVAPAERRGLWVRPPRQVSSGAWSRCSATATRCRSPRWVRPVTVRVHRERIVIWRDAEWLAAHARARMARTAAW